MEAILENAVNISIMIIAGVIITLISLKKNKKETTATAPKNDISTSPTNEDENIIPIIAAAVTATLGEKVVVRKIYFVRDATANTSWGNISRAKNLESHNIQASRRIYGK